MAEQETAVEEFDESSWKAEVEALDEIELEEEQEVEEQEETPEYSASEQEAMQMGWRPEGVEGKRNLTAEEFLDRQKLYDEIKHLKKNSKEMQKAFEALRKHHQRVRESERKKVIEELKLQKRLALETDDYDKVMELDDRISEANKEEPDDDDFPEIEVDTTPDTNAVFENWVSENRWYHTDKELRTKADIVGTIYYKENPNADLADVYNYVTKTMKKDYPEKFGGTAKPQRTAAAVDSGARRTSAPAKGNAKFSAKDLPENARTIMRTLVRTGAVTEEQYLKEYFESA